jgi:5-hydroxyisourate hydrolase
MRTLPKPGAMLAAGLLLAAPLPAASISTHLLDLARGVGGPGIPVELQAARPDGSWQLLAKGTTDGNGRIRSFGDTLETPPGTYRLQFDLRTYPAPRAEPFFPEIIVTFRVSDAAAHYHVPVVLSPFGYSTYRGN